MKISYYELLGLIKEGKNPKKVVYDDKVYIWNNSDYSLCDNSGYITNGLHEKDMFEKNIIILESKEIIEEDKEIEELPNYVSSDESTRVVTGWTLGEAMLRNKINEIIRELNKRKKREKVR